MFLHKSHDFFVGLGLDQTFSNIFERSYQRSVQNDRPFSTVLTKYRKHGSHVIIVSKLHLCKLDASIWVGWWTTFSCLCGWIDSWIGPTDPSIHTMWHQLVPWKYWVFLRCSKLHLTCCLDLPNKLSCLSILFYIKWTKHNNLLKF